MNLTVQDSSPKTLETDWLVLALFEGQALSPDVPAADLIQAIRDSGDFSGSLGETTPLFGVRDGSRHLLLVGLGKAEAFGPGPAYHAGVAAAKRLSTKARSKVAVIPPQKTTEIVSSLIAGLIVGMEGPGIRKREPARFPFESLVITGSDEVEAGVLEGRMVGEAINLARELVNTPPSEKFPSLFADHAARIAMECGLECEIWDRARLEQERFGGVLAVSKGSSQEPRFVQIRYRGAGDSTPVVLVGKGVTFDSGGLSLKPSASMEDMKCDMAGAASVLATIQLAARLKLPVNVDACFALVENMTGGSAMKLGDVLTMRNGLTVEVLNTDAEGRLVLGDILSYVTESQPKLLVDLATLTGACLVALGSKVAGLFSNSDTAAETVLRACKVSGERAWRMPMDDDYGDLIKSKVAEIKNVGGKWAGAITAAKFLQRFVGETPWVHLDIAGPSWADDESSVRDAGGTGCFVRTLIELLKHQAA